MAEIHGERQPRSDDEISLVDLTFIFLKHRLIFYVVFISVLSLGVLYTLFVPHKYDYVSLINLAEKDAGVPIEKPNTVIATLQNRWLPEYESFYHAKHAEVMPFEIHFVNPESTALIRLSSEASAGQGEEVKAAHAFLVNKLDQSQSTAVSTLKRNLQSQIESMSETVSMLEGFDDAGAAIAGAVEKRLSLEATLNSIRPMELLAEGQKSSEPSGPATTLIVVLAGMLGLIGGVFFAFFIEFVSVVKTKVRDT